MTAAVLCCGSMYLLSRLHSTLGNRSRAEADHLTTIGRLGDYIVAVILSQGSNTLSISFSVIVYAIR